MNGIMIISDALDCFKAFVLKWECL